MLKVQFFTLSRPLQDHFVDATRGIGIPVPILERHEPQRRHLLWIGIAVGLVLAWALFSVLGFGDLSHSWAIAPAGLLLVHFVLGFCVLMCLFRAMALRWEHRSAPFRPGVYLFPGSVADARTGHIVSFSLDEVESLKLVGGLPTVKVSNGTTLALELRPGQSFEDAQARFEAARENFNSVKDKPAAVATLDPLQKSPVPNPLAPTTPLVKPRFMHPAAEFLGVVAAAAALSWAVWSVRNLLSERALYQAAIELNNTDSYKAYVQRGGHRPNVTEEFLPRAELAEVVKKRDIVALEKYAAENPTSRIQSEIAAQHRALMLMELEKAKAAGTVTSLEKLKRERPGFKLVEVEWDAAKRALYKQAFERFKQKVSAEGSELVPFVEKLLEYSRVKGPKVLIRFQQRPAPGFERMEMALRKSPYFSDPSQAPLQYFDVKHSETREQLIYDAIVKKLGPEFPSDILSFERGPRLAEAEEPPADPSEPTLFVDHRAQLSGGYISISPRAVFVGAAFMFKASFQIPGQPPGISFKFSLWSVPDINMFQKGGKPVAEVYEVMASEAFQKFVNKLLRTWVGE
jgi:hypothetical protein